MVSPTWPQHNFRGKTDGKTFHSFLEAVHDANKDKRRVPSPIERGTDKASISSNILAYFAAGDTLLLTICAKGAFTPVRKRAHLLATSA